MLSRLPISLAQLKTGQGLKTDALKTLYTNLVKEKELKKQYCSENNAEKLLKVLKSLTDTSDYDEFSKELKQYAKLLNSNILKEVTSKQNKLLELFNLLNNGSNVNATNKKISTNTKKATNKKRNESKNILLEYIGYIDDKLFKKYSYGKNFNSYINEFDRATNEEVKEKVVKELEKIHNRVDHDIETDEDREYINELINIGNAITHFLYYSKKGSGLKILTPNQMLSRLPISLAQLKAGNNSEKLKNEIRQFLHRSKKTYKTTL